MTLASSCERWANACPNVSSVSAAWTAASASFLRSQRFERERVSTLPDLLGHLDGDRRRQRQDNPEPSTRPWVPEIAERMDQMLLALGDLSCLQ